MHYTPVPYTIYVLNKKHIRTRRDRGLCEPHPHPTPITTPTHPVHTTHTRPPSAANRIGKPQPTHSPKQHLNTATAPQRETETQTHRTPTHPGHSIAPPGSATDHAAGPARHTKRGSAALPLASPAHRRARTARPAPTRIAAMQRGSDVARNARQRLEAGGEEADGIMPGHIHAVPRGFRLLPPPPQGFCVVVLFVCCGMGWGALSRIYESVHALPR